MTDLFMCSYNISPYLVIATKNVHKYKSFVEAIKLTGLTIETIKLAMYIPDFTETGESSLENARLKSLYYYNYTRNNTISEDDSIFFHGLPPNKQPGHLVKRMSKKNDKAEFWSRFIIDHSISSGKLIKNYCLVTKQGEKREVEITIPFNITVPNSIVEGTNVLNNFLVPIGFKSVIATMSPYVKSDFRKKYIINQLKGILKHIE